MAGQLEMDPTELNMKFHHVQLFADALRPHEHYRRLETLLNGLAHEVRKTRHSPVRPRSAF
jgi:hypothetical protein